MMRSERQVFNVTNGIQSDKIYRFIIWDDNSDSYKNVEFYSFEDIPTNIKDSFDSEISYDTHFGKATFRVVAEGNAELSKCRYTLTDWQEVKKLN